MKRLHIQVLIWLLIISPLPTSAQTIQVLHLNGSGAHAILSADMFHQFNASTIEAWVKWDRITNWSRVFDFGSEGHAMVVQSDKSSRTLNFAIYDLNGKRHRIEADNAIPAGQWFHLAVTCGPKGMELYINGESKGRDNYTGGLEQVTGGTYYIGRSNWPQDDPFHGYISEFRIWNRQRSRSEIMRTMQRRLTGAERGLVAYWHFDESANNHVSNAVKSAPSAQLAGNAQLVSAPAIAKYLIPGEIEKDVQNFTTSAERKSSQGNHLSAYKDYQAALDLRPGNWKAQRGMLESLDRARLRIAMFPFQKMSDLADPDLAFDATWSELARIRPAYVEWIDRASLEFILYDQGISDLQNIAPILEASKTWNLQLVVLYDQLTCDIDRSRARRTEKKAVHMRATPVHTATGQDSIKEEWERETKYHIVSQNATATANVTVQIIDVKTGRVIDQSQVSSTATDQVEYADYRGNPADLWIEKQRSFDRLIDEEKKFLSRKELKSDTDLAHEVMQNLGTRIAQRIQIVLNQYQP